MYISAFHIDGFGLFHDVTGEDLSPGLSIFFGQNEAGKSTCLEFFRVMLTGYPDKMSQRGKRGYEPLHGGRPGGSLTLRGQDGEMRLSRSPAAYGGLSLRSSDGAMLHEEDLTRLLGGVSRDVYRRIFGFSLEELETWDKKNEESVRNALFGATFGPGLLPPGEAIARLEKSMGKIFRGKGTTQPLTLYLAEFGKTHNQIRSLRELYAGYDNLAQCVKEQNQILQDLGNRHGQLDRQRKALERRLNIFQQWEQWRNLSARLGKLADIPASFPEDAQARLTRLQSDCASCERDLASSRETLRQMEKRVAELVIDGPLAAELPTLRQLAERKSGYRQAVSQLKSLGQAQERAKEDLTSGLAMLGPGWDCQRIRQTDRSLFAREGMEKLAAEMNGALLAHQAAMDGLDQANRDSEHAGEYLQQAEKALADLADIPLALPENEREMLRSAMARLDESRRVAPGRQRVLDSAQIAFDRAVQQAQVFGAHKNADDRASLLNRLLEHQGEAESLAAEIASSLGAANEINKEVEQAEATVGKLQKKMEHLRISQRQAGGSTRDSLESKSSALRTLRSLAGNMATEEERKKELEQRISQIRTPQPLKNWVLICFAILFLMAAAGIFAAHWFWGLDELNFGEGLSLPLNLWASYAALVCGVVLFASGFSAYGPEQKRKQEELMRLLGRSETCSMHLAELAEQSRQLCALVGIDNLDPIALDAMEMLLEREKEQLFHDERSAQEMEALKQEQQQAEASVAKLKAEAQARENVVQQARRRWHGLMQRLNVDNVPSPESVGTIFARAEAAKSAHGNLQIAQREVDAIWEDLHQLEAEIMGMPAIQVCLAAAKEPLSLEAAVSAVMENCKESDRLLEQRNRCLADRERAAQERERAATRQGEAFALLEKSGKRLAEARHAWAKSMEKLGLAPDLDPETLRQAYKCMEDCLAAEDRLQRATQELLQAQAEKQALEEPLKRVAERLKREIRLNADSEPDWLLTLDEFLEAARQNALVTDRLLEMRQAMASQQDRILGLEAALASAQKAETSFLAQGGAGTADEFLTKAALRNERRELMVRIADMELILAQAAQGEPLAAFLAGFEGESRQELQGRLEQVQNELAITASQKQEAATEAGKLEAQAQALASADELANLRQKEIMLSESIGQLGGEWRALALAKELLKQARDEFERERQPEIIRMASEIFAKITDGRWQGLNMNLEDSSIMIMPRQGEPVPPVNLSRGAQEQAYLALRLAYINQHSRNVEPLPVIMDEILVNFDPDRARRTATALAEMAANGKQQLLYFTCHPHMVQMLQETFANASLFNVVNGTIKAA